MKHFFFLLSSSPPPYPRSKVNNSRGSELLPPLVLLGKIALPVGKMGLEFLTYSLMVNLGVISLNIASS